MTFKVSKKSHLCTILSMQTSYLHFEFALFFLVHRSLDVLVIKNLFFFKSPFLRLLVQFYELSMNFDMLKKIKIKSFKL